MKELIGNMWDLRDSGSIVLITTNGSLNREGECIMGAGCALEAKKRFPHIPALIGKHLRKYGNRPFSLGSGLASFPVKPISTIFDGNQDNLVPHMRNKFKNGDLVWGWVYIADLSIIKDSAEKLAAMADKFHWERILLPRPGCGNGNLRWSEVEPILDRFFDNRFFVCTYK
jgi:hypothetical protein